MGSVLALQDNPMGGLLPPENDYQEKDSILDVTRQERPVYGRPTNSNPADKSNIFDPEETYLEAPSEANISGLNNLSNIFGTQTNKKGSKPLEELKEEDEDEEVPKGNMFDELKSETESQMTEQTNGLAPGQKDKFNNMFKNDIFNDSKDESMLQPPPPKKGGLFDDPEESRMEDDSIMISAPPKQPTNP